MLFVNPLPCSQVHVLEGMNSLKRMQLAPWCTTQWPTVTTARFPAAGNNLLLSHHPIYPPRFSSISSVYSLLVPGLGVLYTSANSIFSLSDSIFMFCNIPP